jgi:hypothetical protein
MTQEQMAAGRPLARSSAIGEVEIAFDGDLFERKALADRLTEMIGRLPDGGAIAIDAAWGDGKTWFGRHWQAYLKAAGYRTIYLDAFESDYVEDPFLLLAAEFKTLAATQDKAAGMSIGEKAVAVGRILAPALAKGALSAASRVLTGVDAAGVLDKAIESASDKAGDRVEQLIDERLSELQARRETVSTFRESLRALAAGGKAPIVVFIDELDRCSPTFAVRLLERAKHFFEVPGIVFVLLLNREQLEAAIRGLYGAQIDANQYLHKFLTLTLRLPKREDLSWDGRSFASLNLQGLGAQLGLTDVSGFREFANTLAPLGQLLGMSYRDMERAVAYYGLTHSGKQSAPIVAYLCALKVSRPGVFRQIAERDPSGHVLAAKLVDELRARAPDVWILPLLAAAHRFIGSGSMEPDDEATAKNLLNFKDQLCGGTRGDVDRLFSLWSSRLDLEVR